MPDVMTERKTSGPIRNVADFAMPFAVVRLGTAM